MLRASLLLHANVPGKRTASSQTVLLTAATF